ncbi:MAG: RHS repeat-associated core domain-containing protein, partial [Actinomycetota bacterium]
TSTGPSGQHSSTFGLDLIAVTGPGSTEWAHADQTGDMRLTTGATGQVVAHRRYDAFGVINQSQGATSITHLFDGERLDARTGLYVMRARDYDPAAGLFTGVDPEAGMLSEPLTRHAYQYAFNNPLTHEDRTGRSVTVGGVITGLVIGAVIGAIGGVISAYQQNDGFTHEFIGDATVYGAAGAVGGLVAGILGGALVGILADLTLATVGIALAVALMLVVTIFVVNMIVLVIQGTSPRVAAEEALVSTLAAGVNIARNGVLLLWNIAIGIANYLIGKYEEPGDPPQAPAR